MVKIHLSNQDLLTWKLTFFLFLKENIGMVGLLIRNTSVWHVYVSFEK